MLDLSREFVHERALLALVEAARSAGIPLDAGRLAPTRRLDGRDRVVPAKEYLAVAKGAFGDPRETLGIDLARALPLETTGLWGFLLRSSATFGDMLRRARRHIRVANLFTGLALEERGDRTALLCPHPDPSPYGRHEQVVAAFLGRWVAWGRKLTGVPFAVAESRFRWGGPSNREPFEKFFRGRLFFGAGEDALLLDRDVLALPLPERAPELSEELEACAGALVDRLTRRNDLVRRVHEALAEGLASGRAREADVARRLAVTTRTLHRQLAAEGTSFRTIREELLRERAKTLLKGSNIAITEVSYVLGYAGPANFHRAFRRWTGLTPAQWRGGADRPSAPRRSCSGRGGQAALAPERQPE